MNIIFLFKCNIIEIINNKIIALIIFLLTNQFCKVLLRVLFFSFLFLEIVKKVVKAVSPYSVIVEYRLGLKLNKQVIPFSRTLSSPSSPLLGSVTLFKVRTPPRCLSATTKTQTAAQLLSSRQSILDKKKKRNKQTLCESANHVYSVLFTSHNKVWILSKSN